MSDIFTEQFTDDIITEQLQKAEIPLVKKKKNIYHISSVQKYKAKKREVARATEGRLKAPHGGVPEGTAHAEGILVEQFDAIRTNGSCISFFKAGLGHARPRVSASGAFAHKTKEESKSLWLIRRSESDSEPTIMK